MPVHEARGWPAPCLVHCAFIAPSQIRPVSRDRHRESGDPTRKMPAGTNLARQQIGVRAPRGGARKNRQA